MGGRDLITREREKYLEGAELWSGSARVEYSGLITEGKHTRKVGKHVRELSPKRIKGDIEQMCDSNCVTQHQVRAGSGFRGGATRTSEMQHWDWSPSGDKNDRGDPQALYFGIQGIGGGGV